MFWDDLIRRWRRETPMTGPRMLAGAAGYVAVIRPPRRRRRVTPLVLAILFMIMFLLAVSQVRTGTSTASHATPPPVATSSG